MRLVLVAEGQAAIEHAVGRELQEAGHGLVQRRPRLLRACSQPALFGQQHHCLDEHAEMRPLRAIEAAWDREEQADRRSEQLVILQELAPAARLVAAGDRQRRVEIVAALAAASFVNLADVRRIDGELRGLEAGAQPLPRHRLQLFECGARHHVDMPGLEIARPEGERAARPRISSISARGTGSGRKARTEWRCRTAWVTLVIALFLAAGCAKEKAGASLPSPL
jgi:hypothetical protein